MRELFRSLSTRLSDAFFARRSEAPSSAGAYDLDDAVPLARYIYTRSHFGAERVKPQAFLPAWNDTVERYETSVFQTGQLDHEEILDLAKTARLDRTLKAYANHSVKVVREVRLIPEPDDKPERHVNIIGWPEAKEDRMDLADQLALRSELVRALEAA